MKGNSDKADAIRGALWFVDHDPDVCIDRDEQNARIATYLSQHAHFCYFGRSFKSKHLKPMTVERFRAVMLGIAANTKDRDHDVHGVDVLWKAKSQGLTDDFLAKYEYDKETFDEADLPGPPSGGSQDNIILHPIVPVVTERRITEPSGSAGAQLMTRYHSGLINEVPARRSKLIAILDVEKSIATDSRKYVDHSTRLRALRLLIEQYKLTYWNRSTGLITELRPEQLIKSLRNSFDVGKITTMTDFWSFGCASERSRLRDSKPDIRQYEAQKGLAEYGSLTFVHSSEDIEEALLNIAKSVVEDGVLSEEAAPSAVEWTLNGVDLPLPKLGVCLSSIAQLLAIQDIDRSKVDCDQEYYRYIDRSHQLEALSRITTDHSLQRWDKSKWAIVGLSAEKLHEMLIGLFYRRSSERKKIHFAEIWSKGSPAFGVETMSWLHNRASQLKIYSDIVEPNISETQPPSAKMEEIRSEEDDASADARHSRGQRILSATSDDPPSRHSRKRKAREIEPDTCSISTASGNEHDSDFLPSRPAPSKRIDEAKPRTSLRHGYANFPPMHLTKARPLDRESAATVRRSHMLSNCGDLNEVAPKLASCTLPKARTLSQDIDLRRLFSDVADIASSIQHAVNTLFGSLHLDVVLPSPIPKSSGEALIALFRKCWGESWSSACGRMAASRMCSAINVLKALIAAFLFENIFRGDVSWQAEIFKDFALPVPDQQGTTSWYDCSSSR